MSAKRAEQPAARLRHACSPPPLPPARVQLVLGLCCLPVLLLSGGSGTPRGLRFALRFKVCLKSNPSSRREHWSSCSSLASAAPLARLRLQPPARLRSLRALWLPKQKQSPKSELVSSGAEGRGAAGGGEGAGRRKGKASSEVGGKVWCRNRIPGLCQWSRFPVFILSL